MIKEFMMAALPWVCIGLAIALWAAHVRPDKNGHIAQENFMTEGMCLGMCFGLLLDVSYSSYGLLAGAVIGMLLPKPQKSDTDGEKKHK